MKNDPIVRKPLSLLREDFINGIINLCNNSNLPYFIIEGVMKDILQEIHIASAKQLENDKAKYNEMLIAEDHK